MQEYDFIPAVGKSNKEFWSEANVLAETQDADPVLAYMARMIQEAQSKGLSLRREAFQVSGRNIRYYNGVEEWFPRMNAYAKERGIRLVSYGKATSVAMSEAGLPTHLEAPTPQAPSITGSLDLYLSEENA
jgi:hypothetical protein